MNDENHNDIFDAFLAKLNRGENPMMPPPNFVETPEDNGKINEVKTAPKRGLKTKRWNHDEDDSETPFFFRKDWPNKR